VNVEGELFSSDSAPQAAGQDHFDLALTQAYLAQQRTLDDLPYTDDFESIYAAVEPLRANRSRAEVFRRLQGLRKSGRLPRLGGRGSSEPPRVTPEDEALLITLVKAAVGSLGQRDSLVFTPRFDAIVADFGGRTGRSLSPHDLWRLLAKLAKASSV
jgi:hypothetical protein